MRGIREELLSELIDEGIIGDDTAARIREYLSAKRESGKRTVLVFAVLGTLLVGTGIVLVIAHNWDALSKTVRLSLALLPMAIGHVLAFYTITKRADRPVWPESTATFLFLSLAACLALIGQTYHLQSDVADFLWLWFALGIPVVYILNSTMVSLLCTAVITWYGAKISYFNYPEAVAWWYWVGLASILPHVYFHLKKKSIIYRVWHLWFIAISITIALGMFAQFTHLYTILVYINVFAFFLLIAQHDYFRTTRVFSNGLLVSGSLGMICLFLYLSFDYFWKELNDQDTEMFALLTSPVYWLSFLLALAAAGLLLRSKKLSQINAKSWGFLVAFLLTCLGFAAPGMAQIILNLCILWFGVATIRSASAENSLGRLNYGLLIISALVLCRFFDSNISFVWRGVMFILIGVAFFLGNFLAVKRKRAS